MFLFIVLILELADLNSSTLAIAQSPIEVQAESKTLCAMSLGRPIPENAQDEISRFYPYGSTGQDLYPVHHGVEFVNLMGTPVIAAADGTIAAAGLDDQTLWGPLPDYYGQLIVLYIEGCVEGPVYVLYGHLSWIQVTVGQRVKKGEVIGRVGMSGVALGPHLHFEMRVGQNTFEHTHNPELWLKPKPGYGLLVGRAENALKQPLEKALITIHPIDKPDTYWREAWTYAEVEEEHLNPSAVWRENWTMGDVPPGEYIVHIRGERVYSTKVEVKEQEVTFVLIRESRPHPKLLPTLEK